MLVPAEITLRAQRVKAICNSLKAAVSVIRQFQDNNAQNDPGWATLTGTNVDANGNVVNTNLKPTDIANAIGEFGPFITWWTANGANIEKLCDPGV